MTYEAVSYTAHRATRPLDAARGARTPPCRRDPIRARCALAQALRARAASDGGFVQAVLEYLRSGGFVYSLTPPSSSSIDAVDDFLFHTREGFCGHYASAFVTLMRAGGVPARVVTGYLGGEWNPIGRYFAGPPVRRARLGGSVAAPAAAGRASIPPPWSRPSGCAAASSICCRTRCRRPSGCCAHAPWLSAPLQRWDAAQYLVERARGEVRLPCAARAARASRRALTRLRALWAGASCGAVRVAGAHRLAGRPQRARAATRSRWRAPTRGCAASSRASAPPRAAHQGPLSFADAVIARASGSARSGPRRCSRAMRELRYGPPAPGTRTRDIEDSGGRWRGCTCRAPPGTDPLSARPEADLRVRAVAEGLVGTAAAAAQVG